MGIVNKDDLVLVTGANGFLASHVVRQLLDHGYAVRGTVRDPKSSKCKFLREWQANGDKLELVAADLMKDQGWEAACAGCGVVCHMASPVFFDCKRSQAEEKMYKPARDGTRRVLNAAKKAGTVKKFVQTSSIAAIIGGHKAPALLEKPEEQWTNIKKKGLDPYYISKTLSEKAAWQFIKEEKAAGNEIFDLAVINPCIVWGPPFSPQDGESQKMLREFIMHELLVIPDLAIGIVDVRDVATMHRLAFEKDECAGKRFVAQSKSVVYKEISKCVKDEFGQFGYWAPFLVVPWFIFWLGTWISTLYASLIVDYGKGPRDMSVKQTNEVMGLEFRHWSESVIDHGHKALEIGVKGFKQTKKYKRYLKAKKCGRQDKEGDSRKVVPQLDN